MGEALGCSLAFGSPAPLFGAEEYDMTHHDEIGGRQLHAFLERNFAGHFGPVELDRFMKRPFGPIISETIESVFRVPEMIADPQGVRILPGVGPVCEGYSNNAPGVISYPQGVRLLPGIEPSCEGYNSREYLVSSVDHSTCKPTLWRLWYKGVSGQENVFLGLYDGQALWFGTMKSVIGAGKDTYTYRLYLGHDLIEKRIEDLKEMFPEECQITPTVAFRGQNWTTDVDGVLLTHDGKLYLCVRCSNDVEAGYRLLDLIRGGLGVFNRGPIAQLGMTHDGEVVATYVSENRRVFVNAKTGQRFSPEMSAQDRFVGFWVFNNGTHVIGMEGKSTDRVFTMHLSGQDSRYFPSSSIPGGQILGFRCIGNTPSPMTVWKVKADESVYYTVGKTPQPARFDAVSELFQHRESGRWMYYGLLKETRHICRVGLELPQK